MNPDETLGLPYSQAAEQAVLGAVLNRGQAIDDVGALKPEHFYVGAHREIFRAMLDMSFSGKDIDVITLAEHLDTHGKSEITGGLAYLGQIASNTVSTSVQRYSQYVIDKAMERSMLAVATDIHSIVGSDSGKAQPGSGAGDGNCRIDHGEAAAQNR
jgi:replicative DNA helicase